MGYIGNNLQAAFTSYLNIDDISGSFDGTTTSFSLQVNGSAPVPLPLNEQQCLISVGGVIQQPDSTGGSGFRLNAGNIVFSSAPGVGQDFFGVILAGADYVNAGGLFPDGSAATPSITFTADPDTGLYRNGSGIVGLASNGVARTIANLEDVQTFTAAQIAEVTTLTDAATVTIDLSASNNFTITLNTAGATRTFAQPTNQTVGQSGSIFIAQDGTGSRTITWNAAFRFPGGTVPTLSTGANQVDRVDYIIRGANLIDCVWTGNYTR